MAMWTLYRHGPQANPGSALKASPGSALKRAFRLAADGPAAGGLAAGSLMPAACLTACRTPGQSASTGR
jgi:hypothetical protein